MDFNLVWHQHTCHGVRGSCCMQLGTEFPVRLEAPHVVNTAKQVLAMVVGSGPGGSQLLATWRNAAQESFQVTFVPSCMYSSSRLLVCCLVAAGFHLLEDQFSCFPGCRSTPIIGQNHKPLPQYLLINVLVESMSHMRFFHLLTFGLGLCQGLVCVFRTSAPVRNLKIRRSPFLCCAGCCRGGNFPSLPGCPRRCACFSAQLQPS